MERLYGQIRKGVKMELREFFLGSFRRILVFLVFFSVPLAIELFFSKLSFLLIFLEPIFFGFSLMLVFYWHYEKLSQNGSRLSKKALAKGFFICFSLYFRAFFSLFLFLLPSFFLIILSDALKSDLFFIKDSSLFWCFGILALALFLCLIPLYLISLCRFFLVFPLFFENTDLKISEIFYLSREKTKGERAHIFLFILKELLSAAPSVLIFPAVYFLPRLFFTLSLYSKYLTEKNKSI